MKLLIQPTDYTCGQTCVAMVSGQPVDKVRKIFKEGFGKKHWFGEKTSTKDMVRALRILKIRSRRKIERMTKHTILPRLCIARIRFLGSKSISHWVVCDNTGDRLQVLDPWYGNDKNWPPGTHITSFIEIL